MKTILFQGDSITDCGRMYEADVYNHPAQLGRGYVNCAASRLLLSKPGAYTIINKGVSGNRVVDLYARWKMDALNLNPDIISIHIGVNDVWHEKSRQNGVDNKRFEMIYRMLLEWTLDTLPNVKLLIMEPFALPSDIVNEEFIAEVKERAAIARKIAAEFNAVFLPLQEKLEKAAELAPYSYWLYDGVHPAPAGNQLIADEWIKAAQPFLED